MIDQDRIRPRDTFWGHPDGVCAKRVSETPGWDYQPGLCDSLNENGRGREPIVNALNNDLIERDYASVSPGRKKEKIF